MTDRPSDSLLIPLIVCVATYYSSHSLILQIDLMVQIGVRLSAGNCIIRLKEVRYKQQQFRTMFGPSQEWRIQVLQQMLKADN